VTTNLPTPAPAPGGDRGITRRQLEAVIRRAAELYAAETDADERLSEGELLRIADELGLPEQHVRRALFELPEEPEDPSLVDRVFGPGILTATRTVPSEPGVTFQRLEDYLTTREYLQLRRRQPERALFGPADDTISNIARALSRPSSRFHLARARKVGLAVRPLDAAHSHVRLEVDLQHRRRDAVKGAAAGATIVGLGLGAGAFALVGVPVTDLMGTAAGVAAGVAGGAAGFAAGAAGVVTGVAARFRRRFTAARLEIEGLLDRLERGDRLEPPPSPWRRRLQIGSGLGQRRR
jgi:hypothetical protein